MAFISDRPAGRPDPGPPHGNGCLGTGSDLAKARCRRLHIGVRGERRMPERQGASGRKRCRCESRRQERVRDRTEVRCPGDPRPPARDGAADPGGRHRRLRLETWAEGCQRSALGEADGVAVSPDGRNVYAVGQHSVSIFDRDPATGALTQEHGPSGCSSWGHGEGPMPEGEGAWNRDCRRRQPGRHERLRCDARKRDHDLEAQSTDRGLDAAAWRRRLYLQQSDARRLRGRSGPSLPGGPGSERGRQGRLCRELRIWRTRDLRPQPGDRRAPAEARRAGCISESGTEGKCRKGRALEEASDVALAPGGRSVYVASFESAGVAILDRNPATGALRQKHGNAGCISENGTGPACRHGQQCSP